MKRRAWAGLAVGLSGITAGCTVGSGSGTADGFLFQTGCLKGDAGEGSLKPYSLNPVFFAGEPVEDLSVTGMHTNEMRIRMQNNGLPIQYADTLYFDVLNSYEVGRCVRGRVLPSGEPDWDVTQLLPDGTSTPWCDWTGTVFTDGGAPDAGIIAPGGPDAGASLDGGMSVMATYSRIRLTPYTDVRSSFATLSTCGLTNVTAIAFDGYISFEHFGSAEQPNVPPNLREVVPTDFVIQYGEQMRARFYDILGDQIIVSSKQNNVAPPRVAEIGGVLKGYFDFVLERGRSAQPFP